MERLAEEAVEQRAGGADLEGVPHLAEDLALARHERVEAGGDAEQVQRGAVVAEPVEHRSERRAVVAREREQRGARALVQVVARVVAREVELGAVARREHDRLAPVSASSPASAARAVGVDRDALPQLDGRLAMRDADESEPHDAKWVRGRTTTTSSEPGDEQHREAAAAEPDLAPQDQAGRVERPDRERDRHRHVEVAALEAGEPDDDAGREDDERDEGGAGREPVERLERRQAEAQHAGVALLQPALLPEVEAGEAGRERQPGEGRRASGRRGARAASRPCRRVETPVPPPAQAATSSAAASGITARPSSR